MNNGWLLKRGLLLCCLSGLINAVVGFLTYVEEDEPHEPGEPSRASRLLREGPASLCALPWGPPSGSAASPTAPWDGIQQSWLN